MPSNHFDQRGRAVMVDVSAKELSLRTAVVQAQLKMQPETLSALLAGTMRKGDVLSVARLAGIGASKKTPDLIPLAHPLALHHVSVEFAATEGDGHLHIQATVAAYERTGVEMEAMVAASTAALAVYDMCKGSDRAMVIQQIELVYKAGGRSGIFEREGAHERSTFDS
ncbi:MAG: cyclic pyranopterin monophosphate synthase MoaC [Desulfuromonadaceae bacterium]